jgi:hypothetical protein
MSEFVDATGLADYSLRAYVALRYPSGWPCDTPAGLGEAE